MSLSRPVRFPLLKLPFLCMEAVVKSWDIVDIIFFAVSSKRVRQIVKHLKIPLNGIQIFLTEREKKIYLGRGNWFIINPSLHPYTSIRQHLYLRKDPLVLQNNAIPLYTSKWVPFNTWDRSLVSYTDGHEVTALKMAMEFLNEVFKCSVEMLDIEEGDFPESFGVKSTETLSIRYRNSQRFGYAQNQLLNLLLMSLEVTDTCNFSVTKTKKNFYCDPKLFKCRKLVFLPGSAAWVTKEILMQFEVPRLEINRCQLSGMDILPFVSQWLHSSNRNFEYLYIKCERRQYSLEQFLVLNPVPFSGRNRFPSTESFTGIDFSQGLEIVRQDGFVATIHVKGRYFFFYVWNIQSAITQH